MLSNVATLNYPRKFRKVGINFEASKPQLPGIVTGGSDAQPMASNCEALCAFGKYPTSHCRFISYQQSTTHPTVKQQDLRELFWSESCLGSEGLAPSATISLV
jgi:hypothetical protein